MTQNIEQKTDSGTAATNRLKDYLRGYGRDRVEALDQLASFYGWEIAAAQVLMTRRFSLLAVFDDELLNLINRGQVDVPAAALAVACEFKHGMN